MKTLATALGVVVAFVVFVSFLILLPFDLLNYVAEGDPYRIAVRRDPRGTVEIFYERCGRDVRIHAVSLAHRRAEPLWRVTDPNQSSRERRFFVGSTPAGFDEEIRYEEPALAGHYLVIIDSSSLKGETTDFGASDLRTDLFFGANNEYFSEDQLLDGALCHTD